MRAYATLSIYCREKLLLSSILPTHPKLDVRRKSKNGLHSVHFSSKDRLSSEKARDHVDLLVDSLGEMPEIVRSIRVKSGTEIEIRLWLFQECEVGNYAFVISEPAIAWLGNMGADVCVDIWAID